MIRDRSKGKIRADVTHRKITASVAKGGKGLDPGEAVDSGTQGALLRIALPAERQSGPDLGRWPGGHHVDLRGAVV